jgi:molybdopterin converting factor small subunit
VNIRFYATLQRYLRTPSLDVDIEPADTVRAVLFRATARRSRLRRALFNEEGMFLPGVYILVDGRSTAFLEGGYEARLAGGETLKIFPPLIYGCLQLRERDRVTGPR